MHSQEHSVNTSLDSKTVSNLSQLIHVKLVQELSIPSQEKFNQK